MQLHEPTLQSYIILDFPASDRDLFLVCLASPGHDSFSDTIDSCRVDAKVENCRIRAGGCKQNCTAASNSRNPHSNPTLSYNFPPLAVVPSWSEQHSPGTTLSRTQSTPAEWMPGQKIVGSGGGARQETCTAACNSTNPHSNPVSAEVPFFARTILNGFGAQDLPGSGGHNILQYFFGG